MKYEFSVCVHLFSPNFQKKKKMVAHKNIICNLLSCRSYWSGKAEWRRKQWHTRTTQYGPFCGKDYARDSRHDQESSKTQVRSCKFLSFLVWKFLFSVDFLIIWSKFTHFFFQCMFDFFTPNLCCFCAFFQHGFPLFFFCDLSHPWYSFIKAWTFFRQAFVDQI